MITLTLIISVLFVLLAVCQASDDNSNDPYLGRCALQPQTAFPCMKALFLSEFAKKELPLLPLYPTLVDASVGSDLSFDFHALSTFCSLPTEKTAARGNFILLARRGDCVFDTKAKVAEAIGAKGLLILNSPLQQELVPMGSSEEDYFASIPVVLATSTAFNTALLTSNITLLEARVSIDSKDRVRRTSGEEEVPVATSPLLASIATAWAISRLLVVVIFFIIAKNALDGFFISDGMYKTISSVSRAEVRYLPAVLLLLLVFVLLRLTTLRPMEDTSYTYDYGLLAKYNHRETDEVIFEHLISKVSSNWTNYRVDPVFIRTFSLAEENYDHAVFIHPPLFVYSAAVLVRFFALPLPLVPVLMQSIGLLALWLLSREYYVFQKQIMVESNRKLSNKVSFLSDEVIRVFLLTMLIVMTCPLLWLTSQKIWIDNAVFMSVCISTAVHVWMTNTASLKHRGIKYFAAYQCMSGVLFAVFSLNCKITTLALLPCLSMYTVLALSCEVKEVTNKTIMSWMWRSFVSVSMLVVGSVLGYLPWTYHYWKHTGMFLPSAWPSQTMLERFPFVRQAVMRPWHFYFITLADFSPLHLFGLLFATLLIGICFLKIFFGKIKLIDLLTSKYRRFYLLMVFWLWPFCFVAGLMVLGLAGGGYQQRFLTPMLAGTAFLTSIVICDVFLSIPSNVVVVLVSVVMMWCLWSSLCLSFYFGVLFAPLHAEVSFGIESMISLMLSSSFIIMQSHEEMLQLFEFMKHFGFKVR